MVSSQKAGGFLAVPAVTYMVIFFVAPSLLLFSYSFWTASSFRIVPDFVLTNYLSSIQSLLFLKVTLNALLIGLVTATISVLLSLPIAYYLTYVTRSKVIFY
ncbi:ABC transporter permease, partial [Salmonella enterica subsp. enterica serovar Typhimurium]